MKSPAFQFYPTDYLGSQRVQMLSLDEEAAYVRLLCSCWQHGSIPADPSQAARLVGKGATAELVAPVLGMFIPGEPGRLIHDRLETERIKQAEYRERQANAGRASAQARFNHRSTTVQPEGKSPTPTPIPSPIPSPTLDSNTTKTVGRARALPDGQWLASLVADPAYAGLPVETEIAKCRRWCDTKHKSFSRARIVNWLNRAEQPVNGTPSGYDTGHDPDGTKRF